MNNKFPLLIVSLICLPIAVFFLYISGKDILYGLQSKSWPTTQGVMKYESENIPIILLGLKTKSIQSKNVGLPVYVYTVNNKKYLGRTFQYGGRPCDREFINSYGSPLPVYYNPEKPNDSVLLTGVYWKAVLFNIGISIFVLWIWLFYFLYCLMGKGL